MALKALIFDVDGTLAETEEIHRRAYNRVFPQFDLDWHWDQKLYRHLLDVTGGKERIASYMDEIACPAGDPLRQRVDEIHAMKNRYYAEFVSSGELKLRPGVKRLMSEAVAADIALSIATATSVANVLVLLKANLPDEIIHKITVIATADMVENKKPAPDVYNLAVEMLGSNPDQCIAIEDSRTGLKSAMAAGISTLITPGIYTDDHDFSGAVCVVSDLGEPDVPNRHIAGEDGGYSLVSVEMLRKLCRP